MSQYVPALSGFGLISFIIGVGGAATLGPTGVLVFVPLGCLLFAAAVFGLLQGRMRRGREQAAAAIALPAEEPMRDDVAA
ncbi:hypothetical protein [Naasia lichenicola]|uniref:Uncharacterized protein n=1 Tax=Naasia lichenicola TaxID=2565933 RepID=A0A4S4FL42_9MICO|nr:hypothetical protein [Naasia lichenicola]THG30764.1 hypothetical protein E6C64_08990 [Naasia lichenicola]THG32001.1 hypothetical protein E6C64_08135 [Naasia lichenicola]